LPPPPDLKRYLMLQTVVCAGFASGGPRNGGQQPRRKRSTHPRTTIRSGVEWDRCAISEPGARRRLRLRREPRTSRGRRRAARCGSFWMATLRRAATQGRSDLLAAAPPPGVLHTDAEYAQLRGRMAALRAYERRLLCLKRENEVKCTGAAEELRSRVRLSVSRSGKNRVS
jgi:hypothetical protein